MTPSEIEWKIGTLRRRLALTSKSRHAERLRREISALEKALTQTDAVALTEGRTDDNKRATASPQAAVTLH